MVAKKTSLGKVRATFDNVRQNALANPWLYGGKYTQRNRKDAYIEYLESIIETNGHLFLKSDEQSYFDELKFIFENESIHKLNDADEIISKLNKYSILTVQKSYWTNAVNVEIGNIWTPIYLREDGCELCEEWEKNND